MRTMITLFSSIQFCSVAQSCPTLRDPMDCSTPGFPVHHQLLELAQTHVHRDRAATTSSLCHPFLLLPSIFTSIRVFSNESVNYFMPGAFFFFEVYMDLVSSKQIENLDEKGIQTKIIYLPNIKTVKADNLL